MAKKWLNFAKNLFFGVKNRPEFWCCFVKTRKTFQYFDQKHTPVSAWHRSKHNGIAFIDLDFLSIFNANPKKFSPAALRFSPHRDLKKEHYKGGGFIWKGGFYRKKNN